MSFKIQENLRWIAKALGIDRASSRGLDLDAPATVVDSIQPTVFAKGWQSVGSRPGQFRVVTPGPIQTTPGPLVPPGETWFVYACHVFASGGGATPIRIDLFDSRVGRGVAIRETANVSGPTIIAIPRPVLLLPGQRMSGETTGTVAAPNNFIIEGLFFRLEEGEYFPGGPYG